MTQKTQIAEYKQSADARRRDLRIDATNHVASNKRSWEAHKDDRAILRVGDYDGSLRVNQVAWTSIELTEVLHDKNGRASTRSISITLRDEDRQTLIDMLKREAQPVGEAITNQRDIDLRA